MNHRYIKQLDMSLSPLGFGVMRLPMNPDGTFAPAVHKLITEAYERGINYYDTAYPYLGGHSEELIRDALVARFPRDSFYIADKLPVWDCADRADMDRIFDVQLERLGVRYIDFYLLHGLHYARWLDIREKGALDFLEQKRKDGKIRKIGFSFHDTSDKLTPILKAYDWDFAQLQINYYDWTAQNAKESYDILSERNIPCIVMEPVGGGRLANLPERAESVLKTVRPDASIASWAVRFAAGLTNVAVTLSGMSDMEQLHDNLAHFSPLLPLNEHEISCIDSVVKILKACNTIPCTACGYCVEDCPKNVDIPQIFKRYNDFMQFEKMTRFDLDYYAFIPEARRADLCVGCGKCALHCPQKIDIPQQLALVNQSAIGQSLGINIERLKEKTGGSAAIVLFGAGTIGRNVLAVLQKSGFNVTYFCDNAETLWGTWVDGVPVINPEQLQKLTEREEVYVLITSSYAPEIQKQLDSLKVTYEH